MFQIPPKEKKLLFVLDSGNVGPAVDGRDINKFIQTYFIELFDATFTIRHLFKSVKFSCNNIQMDFEIKTNIFSKDDIVDFYNIIHDKTITFDAFTKFLLDDKKHFKNYFVNIIINDRFVVDLDIKFHETLIDFIPLYKN